MKRVGGLVMQSFDLTNTENSFDLLDISSSNSMDNCYIKDRTGNFYDTFVLARTAYSHTECKISFYPLGENDNKFTPRILLQVVKKDGSVATSNKNNDRTRRIDLQDSDHGLLNFWNLISFLKSFKDIVDTGEFEQTYKVVSRDAIVDSLSHSDNKKGDLLEIIKDLGLSVSDLLGIEVLRKRKKVLQVFRHLLEDKDGYINKYKTCYSIKQSGDEAAWHHFLKKHQWVFGINLDLRFIEDFADEQHVGNPSTENVGNPAVDMTGYSDYTVLIELKTPKKNIFTPLKSDKARTNTWSFSDDFIEGFSQCLGQKFDWDKNEPTKRFTKDNENIDKLEVRTVDPKVVFLYGNKERELPRTSKNDDVITKRDTLERFIRNNRNIEFISYDELYARAEYILGGKKERPSNPNESHGKISPLN